MPSPKKDAKPKAATDRSTKAVAQPATASGRYKIVSAAPAKLVRKARPATTGTISRSAATGRFVSGSTVSVPLGARRHDATVIDSHNGRVRVAIHVAGADEALVSSYRPDQIA